MDTQKLEASPFSSKTIYKNFSLFLIALMVITLLPHYQKLLDSTTAVNISITIHGALYLAWYILFSVQSHLSAAKNINLHKKLGYLSIALVIVLAVSGAYLLIGVMQSYDSSWSHDFIRSRASFVWAITHTLVSFIGFYVLGVIFRKQLHIHKRFMLLASLSMIAASVTRVAFLPFIPVDGMVLTLLSTYGLFLVPVIIDRITFGRVHPVLKWAIPTYIVTQIICIGILPSTEMGKELAFPF